MAQVKPVKAGWWNAMRPWTLHGAVVPVLIGGAAAYAYDAFDLADWIIFLLIVLAGCLIQSAANLLNTYGDYKKGTDTVENETRSPEIVTGVLEPEHVKLAGFACLAADCLLGLVFIWYSGWEILVYGLLGVLGAGMYTTGAAYKYHGVGQPFVFLMMGILMPLGTYCVLAEPFSWDVLLLGLPNAFLITAVLCGNELRDYEEDRRAGVGTLCGRMTYDGARRLYLAENSAAYVVLLVLIVAGAVPWACALAFLALYDMYHLVKNAEIAHEDPHASFMLVPNAFKMNWHFGVLLVIGFIADYAIGVLRWPKRSSRSASSSRARRSTSRTCSPRSPSTTTR